MAEKKKDSGWQRYALLVGAAVIVVLAALAIYFQIFMPSLFAAGPQGEALPPEVPEMILRTGVIIGIIVVGVVFVAAVLYVVWEMFFKKKELHIIQEHHKIIREAAMLNPVKTLGNLVLTGENRIQHYSIGKIVGHTQIPVSFERVIILKSTGKIDESLSETPDEFSERKAESEATGKDKYDFFAFITGKGFYALPIISILEPPKFFACYPCERSTDLLGDIEIFDVGTWKISGVNLFVPGGRAKTQMLTLKEMENQLFPIAYMGLADYLGLIAQRGIEGDTGFQRWIEGKSTTVNVKERE